MNTRNLTRAAISCLLATGLLSMADTGVFAATTGGNTSVALTAGSVTITGAVPGTFTATLTGSDQSVSSTLGNYTVTDATGLGKGWNLTFQATAFNCTSTDTNCPSTGDSLPTNSLHMAVPTVALHTGTSGTNRSAAPTVSISTLVTIDNGTGVAVASAAVNKGMGSYDFTPGTAGTGQLKLDIPSSAYATTYHSVLTVTAASNP